MQYSNVIPTDENNDDVEENVQIVHHSSDTFLLCSFCVLTMVNQALWISFASIKDDVEKYFSLSDPLLVDMFSNIYMFIFLVFFLPMTFFLNRYGLKTGIVVSASVNAAGAFLRYLFALGPSFVGCIFAQSLCAVSQVLNFCSVGALASSVVKSELKGRAIGLIWFSTYFGCAMGLWIPPLVIGDASDDLVPCLLGFGIVAILVCALVIASVYMGQNRHHHRQQQRQQQQQPKESMEEISAKDFGKAIMTLLQNNKYMMVTTGFGLSMGGAYAVATDINSLFAEALSKDTDIGVLGLFFSVSAALGVLLVGVLLTSRPEWRGTTTVSLIMCLTSVISLTGNSIGVSVGSTGFIFICTLLYGFSVTSLNASCLELGQHLSNGSEFIVNGSMMGSVQLFGIILTAITGAITAPDDQRKGDNGATVGALIFLIFTQCTATGLIWRVDKLEDTDEKGGSGENRRRKSSTNKFVSLIANEEPPIDVSEQGVE
jgi:MFS family permease